MRELNSLFSKRDSFEVENFQPPLSPVPKPVPPPEKVYVVGEGKSAMVYDQSSYKFTKYVVIFISIGFVLILFSGMVYLLVDHFTPQLGPPPAGEETSASKIQTFLNAVIAGASTSKGVSGFKTPNDCANQYNNCNYTPSTQTFTCVPSVVNPDIPIWTGPRCQSPIVTPYWCTLIDPANPGLSEWGTAVGSPTVGDPSQLLKAMADNPNVIGATYDLTFTSSRGTYQLFEKYQGDPSASPPIPANPYNVLEVYFLGGNSVVNFDEYSNGVILIFKSLQNIGFGAGVRVSSVSSPPVNDLINGTGAVTRLDSTIITTTTTSPYCIFNPDQNQIQITSGSQTYIVTSSFIPLTNQNGQRTVITNLGPSS